jgi:hypothetical protein
MSAFDKVLEDITPRCVDMHQHFPTLRRLASECQSFIEMGVRGACSVWALSAGLADSEAPDKWMIYIDIGPCQSHALEKMCEEHGIKPLWIQEDSRTVSTPPTDLLMLDTLHTYNQLTDELTRHHQWTNKYIVMHDTEAPWGMQNEANDGSQKQGLRHAVLDFLLAHHDEWRVKEHHAYSHGLTILERIKHHE